MNPPEPEIKQTGTTAVVQHIAAWGWRCSECGWMGFGLLNHEQALKEAANHYWNDHDIAICATIDGEIQYGHPGHHWEHVRMTDSVDECARCHTQIGK